MSFAASDTMTFTGEPVSASIEPAWAAKASGISSRDAGVAQLHRGDDDDRQERGDGAVDADQRRQRGAQQHHQHEQPATARAGTVDELLAGPRRDAGRVEGLADDEQRGDVHDGGITEPGQRLIDVEDAGRPQRERGADRDDLDRHPVG